MRGVSLTSKFCILLILLIVIVNVTATNISEACNQTEKAVSLLKHLNNGILSLPKNAFKDLKLADTKRNVLCNKVDAVINQVEEGAFKGSLNKLTKDIEKAVKKWIVNPWRECLLNLIKRIIKVIVKCYHVDFIPPTIHEVLWFPDTPEYDDYVSVLAYVTDCWSGVANVTLSYSIDSRESVNLTMQKKNDNLYVTEIPPYSYNTTITFCIYAWDNAGNIAVSPIYSYIIDDFHPPVISYIERIPACPNYNETVLILVNATEPPMASGIKDVILTYNNGTGWFNVSMTPQNNLYAAEIPASPYGTVVHYRVYAIDNAENIEVVDTYSYIVDDRFLPTARIDAPAYGEYLSNVVNVEIYVYDDNLSYAQLTVNETVLASWNETGTYIYAWNTTAFSDGVYILKVDAYDKAGNRGEAKCTVIVDNTAPTVKIEYPLNGSYVRGMTTVKISAEDLNFKEMELRINNDTVHVWKPCGSLTYVWETTGYDDGPCTIALLARDNAGNTNETSVEVFVDNTPPTFGNLTRIPSEPLVSEEVNVSVQVFEEGSGIRNVTLWFKTNISEWKSLNMTFQNGNWTCTVPGQAENVMVTFYVECYDNAGNSARTSEYVYSVGGKKQQVTGFPLSWLLLIIVIISIAIGLTTYFYKFRKRERIEKTVALISFK